MTFKTNLFPQANNAYQLGSSTAGWIIEKLNIPTESNNSAFGPGSNGQVLRSNGSKIYWGNTSDQDTWIPVSSATGGYVPALSGNNTEYFAGNGNWVALPVTSIAGKTGDVSLETLTLFGQEYNGANSLTITASDIGLSSSMTFLGAINETLTDSSTANVTKKGTTTAVTKVNGGVVLDAEGLEYVWDGEKWVQLGFATDFALNEHTHGNITNTGTITTDTAKASGQKIVVTDSSNKISRSDISLGTGTTTYLRNDGSWAAPPGTYSLPTASSSVKGGIKVGSGLTISSEVLSANVTGVKGNSESSYRTGNVNLTAANIGAATSGHNHDGTYVKKSGDTMTGRLYINSGNDVGLSSDGDLILGPLTGENISLDGNEIMARNNGATRQLLLNWEGGGIGTKGNSTFYGNLTLSSTNNPTLSLTNSDMDTHASSLAAAEYSSIYFYDKNSSNNLAAFVQCGQATAGNTYIQIAARRRNTANSANITNHITLYAKTDGTMGVGVADAAGWRSAIGAAASSHGTHVSFASSGTPAALGTASHGSASTVARSDHVHAKPSLSDLGAAASSHTHSYLPLSGGTMTGTIAFNDSDAKVQRIGRSKSWVAGRDGALVRITSANAYSPGVSIKTTNGTWEIGHYNAANFHNALLFTYITDTNYNSASNTVTRQYKFQENGTIVGNIDTANKWATARTLTIGSTGKSVDGSGNVSWSLSEIGASVSHAMTAGTTAGPVLKTTVNGVVSSGLTIHKATGSQSGIVTTAAQTFAGNKTFSGQVIVSSSSANYEKYVRVVNGTGSIELNCTTNRGLWDRTKSKWLIYTDGNTANTDYKLYGAVWNDYAECRNVPDAQKENSKLKPGMCVKEVGDGTMIESKQRLERGCKIISDTFGFNIGETDSCKTPIAVSGRVLAYINEGREKAKQYIGWPVCSGPNGTVSIMTEEEEEKYPSRIVGTISEIPNCTKWGTEEVEVDGRIWIYVR